MNLQWSNRWYNKTICRI